MAGANREIRIIAAVPCPACNAAIGQRCRGITRVHNERRAAWVAAKPVALPVRATIIWRDGRVESWVLDWRDRDQRVEFAVRANRAIELGAEVLTKQA